MLVARKILETVFCGNGQDCVDNYGEECYSTRD